jgi:hypothetical protein
MEYPIDTKVKTLFYFPNERVRKGQHGIVLHRYGNGDYLVEFERKPLFGFVVVCPEATLEEVKELEYSI